MWIRYGIRSRRNASAAARALQPVRWERFALVLGSFEKKSVRRLAQAMAAADVQIAGMESAAVARKRPADDRFVTKHGVDKAGAML